LLQFFSYGDSNILLSVTGGAMQVTKGIGKGITKGDGRAVISGFTDGVTSVGAGVGHGVESVVTGTTEGVLSLGHGLFSGAKSMGRGLGGALTGKKASRWFKPDGNAQR
jgi:phage-related protein